MTELEKIAHARTYIENLANGLDPMTGQPVPDAECINNVHVSRYLFYVSDILRQLMENGRISEQKTKAAKAPFFLDREARKHFRYSEEPLLISEITRRINELIQPEKMEKLTCKQLLDWLIQDGFLRIISGIDEKPFRMPTLAGAELGMVAEERLGKTGSYVVVVYDITAQQFILEHLDAVMK